MIENQPLSWSCAQGGGASTGSGKCLHFGSGVRDALVGTFLLFPKACSVPTENNLKLATGGFGCFAWGFSFCAVSLLFCSMHVKGASERCQPTARIAPHQDDSANCKRNGRFPPVASGACQRPTSPQSSRLTVHRDQRLWWSNFSPPQTFYQTAEARAFLS